MQLHPLVWVGDIWLKPEGVLKSVTMGVLKQNKTRKNGSFERPSHKMCIPCLGYQILLFWPKRVFQMNFSEVNLNWTNRAKVIANKLKLLSP